MAPSPKTSLRRRARNSAMTALVLDTGALVALERDDRGVWGLLREATDTDEIVQVPAGVIAQAWRDGSRQVLMVRALAHCDEIPLDGAGARDSGSCADGQDRPTSSMPPWL